MTPLPLFDEANAIRIVINEEDQVRTKVSDDSNNCFKVIGEVDLNRLVEVLS